jgi:nicotinate-nucleotide adenylyltransferase
VLGGTFDPPHIGHLIVATEALWQLRLDEVRLVPAREPPHKPHEPRSDAARRMEWVELAVADQPGLVASAIEMERPGPSYTADTLEAFAAAEPGALLWFVLGADQLEGFRGWRDPGRILAAARLAILSRGGRPRAGLEELAARVAPGRADWVEVPEIGVSSSMIRARIAAGQPIRNLVPRPVEEALRRGGLVASPPEDELRKDPSRPRSS